MQNEDNPERPGDRSNQSEPSRERKRAVAGAILHVAISDANQKDLSDQAETGQTPRVRRRHRQILPANRKLTPNVMTNERGVICDQLTAR
jgi:hypothetical protein